MQKVLYLDDNRVALKIMERNMKGFVEIICASSQSKAFEILESYDIVLILIDYTLEDGNGIEFARKVKRNDLYREIPIVLLSASLTNDLSYFAMRCGINQKPKKTAESCRIKRGYLHPARDALCRNCAKTLLCPRLYCMGA